MRGVAALLKWVSFGTGLCVGGAVGIWIGVLLAMGIVDLNTEIDFCTDTSSGRYITDEAARAQSCGRAE